MPSRREFIKTTGAAAGALAGLPELLLDGPSAYGAEKPKVKIRDVRMENKIAVEADDGATGEFAIRTNPRKHLEPIFSKVRELLIGKDPFQSNLDGEMLWEAIYPGKARLYAEGRDPLTGEVIRNKIRGGRHIASGELFMAFSSVDIALWDLRGKLLGKPVYKLMGKANRRSLPVYWRPGEPKDLEDARRRGREAFDRGYKYQKWYFLNGPKEGKQGLKANIELVRVLREELGPDAKLMFDNHNMRYMDDADYAVALGKAIEPYKIYWLEEPICPEHVDGYARIQGETNVPIAGGEHLYTRWGVQPFLERKCLDFLQVDPVWCGGISEWLKICAMASKNPNLKIVPHITSPWTVAPHCVASQPAKHCPILEYNSQGGRILEQFMRLDKKTGQMHMTMPDAPGIF